MQGQDTQIRTTTCHKRTGFCPLVITVKNGRVTAIDGDREAPLYKGFTCPKGRALGREVESIKRLTIA